MNVIRLHMTLLLLPLVKMETVPQSADWALQAMRMQEWRIARQKRNDHLQLDEVGAGVESGI